MRNLRFLFASVFSLAVVFMALGGAGVYLGSSKAQVQPGPGPASPTTNPSSGPDVVRLVGPVRLDENLRNLPYIPPAPSILHRPLTRYPRPDIQDPAESATSGFVRWQALIKEILPPVPNMPPPLLTFDGINFVEEGTGHWVPDTNGDVGPNHYVQSVNESFRVFDKNGNPLTDAITFNSLFAPLGGGTPCGNHQNRGDPFLFYDQIADRWVITDFAYPFSANSFWECIAVSQTSDPTGAYFLYALQVDPANPNRLGDYPKFGLWPDAYYLTMNEFTDFAIFNGVRVYALDRASMISGGPTNAVGFTIGLEGVGDSGSLVPAGFRTGDPPPAGRDEFLIAVDWTYPGVVLTQVHGWLFHVDFVNPANSTLGVGPDHAPNAEIAVEPFIQAWTPPQNLNHVPQKGTADKLDTLGYLIMTPVVYQNRDGTESLWADQTVMLNYPDGPTAINWYQFDVTGGNFPATPVQQQSWSNGNDGLWRWMPSIAVDQNGNTAIGYSISSPNMFPSIRYAGRLASDPLNDLGQGEAIMTNGTGSQTHPGGRWGDYSMTTIDPADGITFWHTNEYCVTTSSLNWYTRVGKFQFPVASPTPTPTPRATPTPRPRPSPHPRP